MTPTEERLLDALIACRDRFAFYVGHHLDKGDLAKAAENEMFVALANQAINAARQSEPPNFCARCGKRLTPEGVHTCTPPMSRDAELEQARAEEREACVAIAKDAVDGTTVSKYATSREARAARGMAAHILSAIRARGQK